MNSLIEKAEMVKKLLVNLKQSLDGPDAIRGLDKDLSHKCDDAIQRLTELAGTAVEAKVHQQVVGSLTEILSLDEAQRIPHDVHGAIIARVHDREAKLKLIKKQLIELDDMANTWMKNAALAKVAHTANDFGAKNAKIVAQWALEGADLKIESDGEVAVRFNTEDGEIRRNGSGEPISITERMTELAEDPTCAHLFGHEEKAEGNGNPFDRSSPNWNLTTQAKMLKEDPEKAAKLREQASQTANSKKLHLTQLGHLHRRDPSAARKLARKYGLRL